MKKTTLFLWAFVMLLSISMKAQMTISPTVISSSGGFYTGGNVTLSFTVAEMTMVQTFTGGNNFLTQGFQQPEQLTTSVAENEVVPGEILLYPNPTSGAFNIGYHAKSDGEYLVRIYDMLGQLVFAQSYAAGPGLNSIKIDIGQYRQGLYILELSSTQINGKKYSSIHKINLVY